MAKKSTTKKEPKVEKPEVVKPTKKEEKLVDIVISPEKFTQLCSEYRSLKNKDKETKKEMEKIYNDVREYARTNGIKGDFQGLKFTERYSFLSTENIEEAKRLGIEVPASGASLFLPVEQMLKIAKQVGIDESLVKISYDTKALEKIFKDAGIQGFYSMDISIGISSVE